MRFTHKRHALRPADIREMCHEVSTIGDGAMPLHAIGWTRKGCWTRIEATYPNGWKLIVQFNADGSIGSHSASFTFRAQIRGAQIRGKRAQGIIDKPAS